MNTLLILPALRRHVALLFLLVLALLTPVSLLAQRKSADPVLLPNFDARTHKEGRVTQSLLGMAAQNNRFKAGLRDDVDAAQEILKYYIPGLKVEHHAVLGGSQVVTSRGGFLTPPASGSDAATVVHNFLNAVAPLYGLSDNNLGELETVSNAQNPSGNLRWVFIKQRIKGIPVFRGEVRAAVTPRGEIASMVSELAVGIDPGRLGAPRMTPDQAIRIGAQNIGVQISAAPALLERSADGLKYKFDKGPLANDIAVDLVVFPLEAGRAVLGWQMLLWQNLAAYYVVVDDGTGQILFRKSITEHQSQPATYNVYASDSPAPLSPSNATPGSGLQGTPGARTDFTVIHEHPSNSSGWIPDGSCVTTGNNVDAGLDLASPDGIDVNGRATGSAGGPSPGCRNFSFSYNPAPGGADAPSGADFRSGAVTNLFFWANRYHDQLYSLGFTEEFGNFQNDNFGRGGLGNDRVLAEAQDFSGSSNANFATPSDGLPGRLQMYIFNASNPDRDASLDQEVILHELTHGLSNRLIGNALGLTNLQDRGMGEGWSDFYALSLLSDAADDPNGRYAIGGYSLLEIAPGFTDNYVYGIRRFPYTTDMSFNPQTFADIDPTQINNADGAIPPSPISNNNTFSVHNIGEIWASMLWEGRANMIARLGGQAGNQRMLQVVTDGMKLTPSTPTFVQGRDAILQAACAGFGGAEEFDLWRGFAKRGLGAGASAPASTTTTGVVESFDLPLGAGTVARNDSAGGNGNGFIDPGEIVALTIPAMNDFNCVGLTGVTGNLSSATAGVTVIQGSGIYGAITAGSSSSGTTYEIQIAPGFACGSAIDLTLNLNSNEGVSSAQAIKLRCGQPVFGNPVTFNYTGGQVQIPDAGLNGANAAITVSGMNVVGDLNVNLANVAHTYIGDMIVQLIGPDGKAVNLISLLANFTATNSNDHFINTVLDDEAFDSIQPQNGSVSNESFKPENPLSAFDDRAGNGIWTLKIIDAIPGDLGSIHSWSLTFTPVTFNCAPFTVAADEIAPANVANLKAGTPTKSSITLSWTAPGDDGNSGTATTYDIRYSTVKAVNWLTATPVSNEPAPMAAGSLQTMTVGNLLCGRVYYFALVSSDEANNISTVSNVAKAKTARCNKLKVTPAKLAVGEVNVAYHSGAFGIIGGDAPYAVQVDPAMLPPGISYASQSFSGTPTLAKTFVIPATITDAVGSVRKVKFKLKIANPVTIATTALKPGKANVNYSAKLKARDGVKAYSWSLDGAVTLPGGVPLELDSATGKITVLSPGAGGPVNAVFRVTDAAGGTHTQVLALTFN
jgi:subtilisin-like proprotein convertase family protein